VKQLKTRINPSKKGKSLMLTIYEGYFTYSVTVPLPYAVRVFAEGIVAALETLNQSPDLQAKLDENEGEKAEIQEHLRKAVKLFDGFLKQTGR
jgi:hypothetical protein